jgi:uncharacterized protein YjiS (DUF1127 family)
MKKWLFRYAFNLALKSVNEFLEKNRENLDLVKVKLDLWLSRAKKVLELLERADKSLEDNRLTQDEIEEIYEEALENVKSW